ncbi:hypothetical protein ASD66_17345 [Nocardioides sp. Root151]|nr:hypothetical protein ASD66_17345 [Nocardioides sp. Root151]
METKMSPLSQPRKRLRTLFVSGLVATLAGFGLTSVAAPAHADNRVTPGDFTGYGFDQCLTPTQSKMDAWMEHSPFSAVGIYISGDSRACRSQPNLTPSWVTRQLANRWVLLPITLGPQADCLDRFPRYGDDETIKPSSYRSYQAARGQGRREADKAVAAAKRLGIVPGSTLWYDLEGFNHNITSCRESAIYFLHAWTGRLHTLGYVSGVYSSAGSGIKMLDDARVNRPGRFTLPDRIWIARWDGVANTSTDYIREDGWQPHRRVKQYRGGHNETWGGTTINIDSNFLDVGKGSWASRQGLSCGGKANINLSSFPALNKRLAPSNVAAVKALQCQLTHVKLYAGAINGRYDTPTIKAINAFQRQRGLRVAVTWTKRSWVMLNSTGAYRTVKRGHTGPPVRLAQRALTAATGRYVPVTGVFDARTEAVTKLWQRNLGGADTGVMNRTAWSRLRDGRY